MLKGNPAKHIKILELSDLMHIKMYYFTGLLIILKNKTKSITVDSITYLHTLTGLFR